MKFTKKILVIVGMLFLASCASEAPSTGPKNDVIKNSAMITNLKANSGGTGIVLKSHSSYSTILTNSHVCHVVENGGLVESNGISYMVTAYKRSAKYDLCLVKVDKDLGYNTRVANHAPRPFYEPALVSGHPALYPTTVTRGFVSGRKEIAILVGIKPCTEEDFKDPQKGLFCAFAGGLPIIKYFDSVLVSATIMPGSSGSGVYNRDTELAGVVFAGQGELGYAWTVPYEAVRNFLDQEQNEIPFTTPTNTSSSSEERQRNLEVEEKIEQLCQSPDKTKVKDICNSFQSNMIWHK